MYYTSTLGITYQKLSKYSEEMTSTNMETAILSAFNQLRNSRDLLKFKTF